MFYDLLPTRNFGICVTKYKCQNSQEHTRELRLHGPCYFILFPATWKNADFLASTKFSLNKNSFSDLQTLSAIAAAYFSFSTSPE